MIRYLVFDIETRVDKALVKQIYDPENALTLEQAYDKARDQILERSGQQSDFFPVPFHIPIAIATLQADENYRIRALGCLGADRFSESELVARFWQVFENAATLVTFNGRGFDLPVLEMQARDMGCPCLAISGPQIRSRVTGETVTVMPTTSICAISSPISAPLSAGVLSTSSPGSPACLANTR